MSLTRTTEVFYTTDKGFAVPTIASIKSLRKWPSAKDLSINVVTLGMNDAEFDAFKGLSSDLNINLHAVSSERLSAFNDERFKRTHVPYSTLARFLIPAFVRNDESLDLLYIDGDTWFIQDPKPLLDIQAPKVGLLASEDQSYFYMDDFGSTGRSVKSYFNDIAVDRTKGYFNAGVIKCRATEWVRISADCLSFLRSNLSICRYHDQSALNAIAGATRTRLSPAWNFQTTYWGWNVSAIAEPKLLHFVGGAKPWMGLLNAWSGIYPEYSDVIRARSHHLFPLRFWDPQDQIKLLNEERLSILKNRSIYLHRTLHRRRQFRKLVATSIL